MKKTFKTTIVRTGALCFIPVPFDPKEVFGRARAPVKVTINDYTYGSAIASKGDGPCIPLRRSHREAAKLDGTETVQVTVELDATKKRERRVGLAVESVGARPAAKGKTKPP